MARPKKYSTDEEKKAARREAQRRYRAKKKFQALPENDIMNMGINVLPTQSQVSHDERLQQYYNRSTDNKLTPVKLQLNKAFKILDLPTKRRRKGSPDSFKFEWDDYDKEQQDYLFKGIGQILKHICDIMTIDSKWIMKFSLDDLTIKSRKITYDNAWKMIQQLEKEGYVNSIMDEFSVVENSEYDFFPVEIKELKQLEIKNLNNVKRKKGPRINSKYKRHEGAFWRWILKVPINLQRYQIFNTLNDKTIKLMTQDNCIIYACIQYGLDENIIKNMRDIFKTRYISMNKLKELSDECNIHFTIRYNDSSVKTKRTVQIGQQYKTHIKLLLMNDHYMLDESVPISPYYIRHYKEINSNPKMKDVPIQKRFTITKFHNGVYESSNDKFDLRNVLNALFDIDAFKPITQSELMTYKSSLYKEKLDDIDTLEYDPKLCCRLKAPPSFMNVKKDIKDVSDNNEFYE